MIKFIADIFKDKKGKPLPCIKEIVRLARLTIIRFQGSIDSSSMPSMQKNIADYTKNTLDRDILLDFKDVTHVDSSTVASIILLLNNVKKSHRKLGAIHVTSQLLNFLSIERIDALLHVYRDEEEALKELA